MVTDKIENAEKYYTLGKSIKTALKYLRETDFTLIEPGKYEIDGNDIYAIVVKYDTRKVEEGKWEAHRKYIDVQYVFSGEERLGYSPAAGLQVIKEYDDQEDYLFLEGEGNLLICRAGTFAVFWPEDAHIPGLQLNQSCPVKKVVVKIKARKT